MLKGITIILLFQLLGEALVALLNSPVPGGVAGMLMLLVGLAIKGGPSTELNTVSQNLIQHLSLFFLPAGVGLFFLPADIRQYWPAVAAAMVAGTFISMIMTGWLAKQLSPSEK